jgi:cell division protein FtsI (penicillin-binding protein 3)
VFVVKNHKKRIFVVASCFFALYFIIIVRLLLIQVLQKKFFKTLAKYQHHVSITIDPPRASIFDRNHRLLSFNKEVSSAFVLPRQLIEQEKTMMFLKKYFEKTYDKIVQSEDIPFVWLDRKILPGKIKKLQDFPIKDIQFINESSRFYSFPECSQIVGFTDIDNNGIAGVELYFSEKLRGNKTELTIEKDARSEKFYIEKNIQQSGSVGTPLILTIDSTLQSLVYEELKTVVEKYKAKLGSVLVMDPKTGEILVMANYPSFDANEKIPNMLKITNNNIVTECYEMGSVMKIFTAIAALKEGVVDYDEIIDCEGKIAYIDGFRLENPTILLLKILEKNNNKLPFFDVVRYSSNVGIAKIAKRLGKNLYKHLKKIGFGEKTNIQFPGERKGFVNHPDNWSKFSVMAMSFGYETTATLLQLGRAVSIIANGGYSVQPTLIKNSSLENTKGIRLYEEREITFVNKILSAIGERYPVSGYGVKGKTGTAKLVVNGEYSKEKHTHTFAGFIEKEDYKRVVITFICEPNQSNIWASQIAAPLFQKVAEKLAIHDIVEFD